MKKMIIILTLTVVFQVSYIIFMEVKSADIGKFENAARTFEKFENMNVSDMFLNEGKTYVYFDSKKVKQCIKDVYGHLTPYINQMIIENQNMKYLLGYNDNTYAVTDGLGNLKLKSSSLYGYKNVYSFAECKKRAEEFLTEKNITQYVLQKSYDFCGIYYFKYGNPDGRVTTVGIDKEYCEIKYLNQ